MPNYRQALPTWLWVQLISEHETKYTWNNSQDNSNIIKIIIIQTWQTLHLVFCVCVCSVSIFDKKNVVPDWTFSTKIFVPGEEGEGCGLYTQGWILFRSNLPTTFQCCMQYYQSYLTHWCNYFFRDLQNFIKWWPLVLLFILQFLRISCLIGIQKTRWYLLNILTWKWIGFDPNTIGGLTSWCTGLPNKLLTECRKHIQ